ncbi:MAG TPA: lipopolysaccharide heptosyltransferase II [Blastocatellia bacterium]|nr:lipopolysaccharide heptosyltransferase II [Blastocatellia bacterium]
MRAPPKREGRRFGWRAAEALEFRLMFEMRQMLKGMVKKPFEFLLRAYLKTMPSREFAPDQVNRILVFAYHGLGNFIMYTPALKLLRERYPNARIDLQVGNETGCEEVLSGSELFDNIYNVRYRAGIGTWLRRTKQIRDTGYDLTINEFHSHSWKLALVLAASRVPFRAGHSTSPGWARRFSPYSFVFNLPVVMKEDEHEVDRYIDLVERLGTRRVPLSEARSQIFLSDSDRRFALDYFSRSGIRAGDTVLGIQPGTSPTMTWKQWPIERYRDLIERLVEASPRVRIVLFGSAHEVAIGKDLTRGLEQSVTLAAGKTTVKQVAAMIERCRTLICNDSGLMHVAAAVGTPVIAIYGPTDIRRTSPLGDGHTVIRRTLSCSPCFKLEGEDELHRCPHHDCLMTIPAEEVFQRARDTALAEVVRPSVSKQIGKIGIG